MGIFLFSINFAVENEEKSKLNYINNSAITHYSALAYNGNVVMGNPSAYLDSAGTIHFIDINDFGIAERVRELVLLPIMSLEDNVPLIEHICIVLLQQMDERNMIEFNKYYMNDFEYNIIKNGNIFKKYFYLKTLETNKITSGTEIQEIQQRY